ncbi:MAG: PAS domain-containing protein [Bacteroidetes bacterium]|nr:PAS domain-containing protein [Bacteroidota bacterium]
MTIGLCAVQGEGGMTMIAGDENGSLKEPGSFLSDCADLVVEPDGIADRLSGLAGRLVSGGLASLKAGIDGDFLTRIFLILSERKGLDLFVLKEEDVARHVFRRMVLTDMRSREEYYDALVSGGGELDLLGEELMGCSTGFSPEPGLVMQLVDRILPAVLESKADQKPLRIWMPGCTCGEEVYAVAFCVVEYLKEKRGSLPVQLFASSLNRTAILKARTGCYDEAAMRKVSAERRRKFFIERDGQYHVVKAVKDICVFAMHNLIKDPPFSHIDVVIGRNMMAGMDRVGQKKVVESLHYALNEGGWLVSVGYRAGGINEHLFRLVSDSPGVYRRLDGRFGFTHAAVVLQDTSGESEASKVLMSGYVPASILIDEGCRVVHFYGNVEPYLRPWEDRPSLHLLKIVRDELVFDIGEMLGKVARDGKQIRREGILLADGDKSIGVDVIPLSSPNKKWRLVIIRPMALGDPKPAVIRDSRDRRIEALKKELAMTREQLVMAYEQSASAQEALYSANEEMMASNEELQSINDGLQGINQTMERTMGELQSHNTELDSVNKDLHQRNRGLEVSVEHAYAVIAAIRQPLMVLKDDLRIQMVNSCLCQTFGVHADDLEGEYLYTAARGVWDIEELREKLQGLAAAGQATLEVELKHVFPKLGERVLVFTATRIREDGKSGGILLTMEDVTIRRMAERI